MKVLSWPLGDVRCSARRTRRDISCLQFTEARLALPEDIAVLAIFPKPEARWRSTLHWQHV